MATAAMIPMITRVTIHIPPPPRLGSIMGAERSAPEAGLIAVFLPVALSTEESFAMRGSLRARRTADLAAAPLALYTWLRPTVATPGWSGVVYAVMVGQAWMLARLTLRLTLLGAQTALYQSASSSSSLGK